MVNGKIYILSENQFIELFLAKKKCRYYEDDY
jgi:hypothetical protein